MGRGQFSLVLVYEAPKWTMLSQTMGVRHHLYYVVHVFPLTYRRHQTFVEVRVSPVLPLLWMCLIRISVITPVINTKRGEAKF